MRSEDDACEQITDDMGLFQDTQAQTHHQNNQQRGDQFQHERVEVHAASIAEAGFTTHGLLLRRAVGCADLRWHAGRRIFREC